MKDKKASKSECVKVAIRVRPMNKHEIEENSRLCVTVDTANNTVSVISDKNQSKTFPFDYVYPMETTQREVYDQVAFPIVDSIFQGYNGTVFAYGQTGCGKTFTMMGIVTDPNLKGIIPNAFSHIFGFIKTEGESKKFFLRCSFVEIYNEEVRDLLGKNNRKLDIREDPKKGTFLRDVTYITIKNTSDIENCLERGNKNRHVGQTSMNDQSSRSHSLFTVYLEIEEKGEGGNSRIKSGKLNLVDLAGSERVGKTNATGQTFDEGKKINLSLTALGSVIDALSQNRKYVPYKDSKLTRLLADSLGGNTKTVMFANISPASYNYDETLGTLRYASRAKLIKNAPVVNEDPKDALLRKYEEEIKALKEKLANGGNINEVLEEVEEESDDDSEELEEENKKIVRKYTRKKSVYMGDDPEKIALLAKISELEKDLIDNVKLEDDEARYGEEKIKKKEFVKRIKEQEEENRKFKEYRERQMKENEEMEKKMKKLQEQKEKEEELLKNDANKLQEKINELNSEIEDLKNEGAKDRSDYLESVKEISRENDLYKKIINVILNENQFKKICEMSRYIEDDNLWKIKPFSLKENKIAFSNVNPSQVDTFIEGNIAKRELIIDGINENPKKIIFKNYENDEDNQKISDKNINNTAKKLNELPNQKLLDDKRINLRVSKDKFLLDAGNPNKPKDLKELRKTVPENNPNGVNLFLMNKKEREKFEELSNMNNNNNKYMNVFKKTNGKIFLNPVGGHNMNNLNKLELNHKTNLDLGGGLPPAIGNRNKIKLPNFSDNN
jgi:kinesin family protein 3/17